MFELDISAISAIVAATGVLVGVVLAVLELRNLVKQRKSDFLMRLHLAFTTKETVEACMKYLSSEYKDYDDFVAKYGSPFAEGQVQTAFVTMGMFMEGIGVLLHRKLVDLDLIIELFAVEMFWLKMKPLAEGMRKQINDPRVYEWFEYLYNEMKQREQKLQSKT